MSEWIEHDGKSSPPLPIGTKVVVRYHDGFETTEPNYTEYWGSDDFPDASNWVWPGGLPEDVYITAYRIVEK